MKKSITHLLAFFLPLVFLLVITACTSTNNEGTSKETPEATLNETAVSYPLTITDLSGTEITIEKEPTTIISVSPNITEIIYALGAEDKLVARTDYCDYPKEVSEIESIGAIQPPDMERIVELHPDLVIVSTHFSKENAALLKETGITVLALFEEESFEGSYLLTEKLGQALNRQKEAADIIKNMKATVDEVTALVDGQKKPSVYYVVSFGEYGDFTAGGNTFIGKIIEMAGGNNIAADVEGWEYNLESLLEADPDIIIVSNQYDTKASFESTKGYKDLRAVSEGKVYEIDNNMLDRQGVRNAEGLKALAQIFHPEVFE